MGFYTRLKSITPKQFCVLCMEPAEFCICQNCADEFSNQQNRCLSCAHSINHNLDFCKQCLEHSPIFNRAYTLYDYQSLVAQLIKTFKYDKQFCIGNYFAHKLNHSYQSMTHYDAIIPMPLSPQRIRERGFNQVLELLSVIKRQQKVVIDTHSVQRIKATKPLSNLNPEQRKLEIKGAFHATPIRYQRILLVDDIMTTGASLNELAKTLMQAGAQSCDVLVLAKA